jgi:hypothetical protein
MSHHGQERRLPQPYAEMNIYNRSRYSTNESRRFWSRKQGSSALVGLLSLVLITIPRLHLPLRT